MSNSVHTNGKPQRKTLAAQLDRLDTILETLNEGLNDTIAGAVRQAITLAVQQAVEAVLNQVITQPELLRSLAAQAYPQPQAQAAQPAKGASRLARFCSAVRSKVAFGWQWLSNKVSTAYGWLTRTVRELPSNARSKVAGFRMRLSGRWHGFWRGLRETAAKVWYFRCPLSLSITIGLVVGLAAFAAGPVFSAFAAGACSAAVSLGAYLLAPFVRLWRSLQGQGA
jgi:hypothetical protein